MLHAVDEVERAEDRALLCAALAESVDALALAGAWGLSSRELALIEDASRQELARVYDAICGLKNAWGNVSDLTRRRMADPHLRARLQWAAGLLRSDRP